MQTSFLGHALKMRDVCVSIAPGGWAVGAFHHGERTTDSGSGLAARGRSYNICVSFPCHVVLGT